MAQGTGSHKGMLPAFQTSNLSEEEQVEAISIMNYVLSHAHHIANENGCAFQGKVLCIHGMDILVNFKVDYPDTAEFPKMEDYSTIVCLNL